jgi:hypothetical protein
MHGSIEKVNREYFSDLWSFHSNGETSHACLEITLCVLGPTLSGVGCVMLHLAVNQLSFSALEHTMWRLSSGSPALR